MYNVASKCVLVFPSHRRNVDYRCLSHEINQTSVSESKQSARINAIEEKLMIKSKPCEKRLYSWMNEHRVLFTLSTTHIIEAVTTKAAALHIYNDVGRVFIRERLIRDSSFSTRCWGAFANTHKKPSNYDWIY